MLKYEYIFYKWKIRMQFHRTALGNCYDLASNYQNADCSLKKNKFIVLFIIKIFGTFSFHIQRTVFQLRTRDGQTDGQTDRTG